MCENNYGYMVSCHENHHQQNPAGVGPVMVAPPPLPPPGLANGSPYEEDDYYAGPWTNAEYVPNNSDQCQLE